MCAQSNVLYQLQKDQIHVYAGAESIVLQIISIPFLQIHQVELKCLRCFL